MATPPGLRCGVLSDALGLARFEPAPEFGQALAAFVGEPSKEKHDRLWRHCAFDLERLRSGLDELGLMLSGQMSATLADAEAGAARLLISAETARPNIEQMRDAAIEAANRIESGASNVEAQQERLAALMTSVDLGVSQAEQRLTELSASIAAASEEAGRLSNDTGPALVSALVQVREAAA